jgi:hypothetical protein
LIKYCYDFPLNYKQEWAKAKTYYEKAMSEHRTPELKALLSDVDKRLKEFEKKAYIDPVKAEEGNQKGNEYFKNGNYVKIYKDNAFVFLAYLVLT